MEKQYISIKEASELFSKSLSTIRRTIKETPLNRLKKEKLKTGHEKIYIELEYLNDYFNDQLNPTTQSNYSETTQNNSSNDVLIEQLRSKLESEQYKVKSLENIITILNKELESKNKQIDSLLQRNYETNILMKSLQEEKIKLDTFQNNKKRKWWQRG